MTTPTDNLRGALEHAREANALLATNFPGLAAEASILVARIEAFLRHVEGS